MPRTRNTRLAAVFAELGWFQEQVAARFRRVAAESDASELLVVTRSHVSQWVLGSRPKDRAARILCETLSRGLRRPVSAAEIGLTSDEADVSAADWFGDTASSLVALGSGDLDMERRHMLAASAYSLTGLALPQSAWWDEAYERARERTLTASGTVSEADVASVREMMTFFSQRDQRRGGADGRDALVAYLRTDVGALLSRRAPLEEVRRELFSAAAELTYLAGWMAFDASVHSVAQRYFTLAVRLAAEAGDAPLCGHILRAMAHQAVDLRHPRQALDLAAASVEEQRYALASPREKALLGVVHARALAAAGRKRDALAALLRAEDDLGQAGDGDGAVEEPGRVFFFAQASLAHETACTLRDLGDLKGAERQFKLSVRTRRKQTFRRTHSVTLGYLGAVQAQQGAIDAACATWPEALDAMDGVQSGRARDTVVQMRRALSPFRGRGGSAAADLDERVRDVLRNVG